MVHDQRVSSYKKKGSIAKIFFDYSIGTKLRPVDAIIQIEHANLFDNV